MATAPPLTLVRSRMASARRRSPSARTSVVTNGTAAKASLISIRSTCVQREPGRDRARPRMAVAGMEAMRSGLPGHCGEPPEGGQHRPGRARLPPGSASTSAADAAGQIGGVARGDRLAPVDRGEVGQTGPGRAGPGHLVVVDVIVGPAAVGAGHGHDLLGRPAAGQAPWRSAPGCGRAQCVLLLPTDAVLERLSVEACRARGSWVCGQEMTSWSLSSTSPRRKPQRTPSRKYGTRLRFSTPPATATADSPRRIDRHAAARAVSELQQARSTV